MAKIETNLQGRIRNTPLPWSRALLPLFEAVVNSLHAVEEAGLPSEDGRIRVRIDRAPATLELPLDHDKKKQGPKAQSDILGFTITDNGIGFDDENMKAFRTLDTDHKVSKGGRGVGRLLWLKAFRQVEVSSTFLNADRHFSRRSFVFDSNHGISRESVKIEPALTRRETTVSLIDFDNQYRKHSYKSADAIAKAIFEHCLWYFVRPGGSAKIIIEDSEEHIDLDLVCSEHIHSSAKTESVLIKGRQFDLLHIKLRTTSALDHMIAYCADNRLVCEEKLSGRVSGLYGRLSDSNGDFTYACYVSSKVLNECARPERTGFDLADESDPLYSVNEITWEDIRQAVSSLAAKHLEESLQAVRQRARERLQDFVKKAPRYRSILGHLPQDALNIDPYISDKELDQTLHRHLSDLEGQLISEGHDLMVLIEGEAIDEYRQRLNDYLRTAEDIKKSDLANYVSHRKVILDLLQAALHRRPDGKYVREDIIHNLIMPMRKDSTEVLLDNCNLWLVDERLAFHNYLASDKPLWVLPHFHGQVS